MVAASSLAKYFSAQTSDRVERLRLRSSDIGLPARLHSAVQSNIEYRFEHLHVRSMRFARASELAGMSYPSAVTFRVTLNKAGLDGLVERA